MDRPNHRPRAWLPLALIAAGALGGGISAAAFCLIDWRRGRRT